MPQLQNSSSINYSPHKIDIGLFSHHISVFFLEKIPPASPGKDQDWLAKWPTTSMLIVLYSTIIWANFTYCDLFKILDVLRTLSSILILTVKTFSNQRHFLPKTKQLKTLEFGSASQCVSALLLVHPKPTNLSIQTGPSVRLALGTLMLGSTEFRIVFCPDNTISRGGLT